MYYLLLLLYTTAGLPVIKKHPLTQVVNNSEKITFECFVSGSKNLTVTWERDGNQYASGRIKNKVHNDGVNSSLTLNRAMVDNSGKYRCRATNIDGMSATSNEAELISKYIHVYRVTNIVCSSYLVYCFTVFPQITMNPDNVTVLIGQTVQITCRALGTDIVYQWMKDGSVVSELRRLRLTNIQESDEGTYMCRASNKGGVVVSNPGIIIVYGELAVNVNYN